MRLRLVEIEGTPEEIARLDIEHLLGHPLTSSVSITESSTTDGSGTDADSSAGRTGLSELDRIVQREAPPGKAASLLEQFFEAVTSWGDVSVVPSWRAGAP